MPEETSPIPRLRFPEFRKDEPWEVKQLGTLVKTITPPKKIQTSGYHPKGRFPIIDQSPNGICGWTDDETALVDADFPLVIFGDHSCVVKLAEGPFAQGADGIKILAPVAEIEARFLYWYLRAYPIEQRGYRRHFSSLKEKQISFPSRETGEQQMIADCLTSLEDLIRAEQTTVAALRAHKRGLMQQLFPAPGETTPHLRFPKFREVGPWETKPLSEIADVLQGYGFPEKHQGKTSGKYPFYKVSDISNALASGSFFIEHSANYVDDLDLKALKAKTVPKGTTIFAKIGEAIRSNKRALTTKECVIDNNTAGVSAKEGQANGMFLFYLFSMVNLIDHSGGVVPAVNKTAIESMPLTCPDLSEQRRIADCLSSLDDLIREKEKLVVGLEDHKRGLMQRLLPGEPA